MSPEDAYVRQSSAQVFIMMEKQDRALEIYGPAYIQTQDNPLALSNYGRFWAGQKKNLDSALEAAKKATTLADQSLNQAYHWDALATVYVALGKPEEALKAEEKALSLDEGFNTEHYQTQLKKIKDEIEKKTKK